MTESPDWITWLNWNALITVNYSEVNEVLRGEHSKAPTVGICIFYNLLTFGDLKTSLTSVLFGWDWAHCHASDEWSLMESSDVETYSS